MSRSLFCCCLFILSAFGCNAALGGTFDLEEIQVAPSPAQGRSLEFKGTEKVLDFDVAKDGPRTAILVQSQSGGIKVVFWNLNEAESPKDGRRPRNSMRAPWRGIRWERAFSWLESRATIT